MHNVIVGGNNTDSMKDNAMSALDNAVSNIAYSHWLSAAEFQYISGTPVFSAPSLSLGPPYWQFYEGSAGYVGAYIRKSVEWRDGFVSLNLHWWADEASTDAVWSIAITPIPTSYASATIPDATANLILVPVTSSSATALQISSIEYDTINDTSQLDSKHGGIYVIVGKRASPTGDSMTVDRRLYGVELIYNEDTKRSGSYERPSSYDI
jgi:hypothetical protein